MSAFYMDGTYFRSQNDIAAVRCYQEGLSTTYHIEIWLADQSSRPMDKKWDNPKLFKEFTEAFFAWLRGEKA